MDGMCVKILFSAFAQCFIVTGGDMKMCGPGPYYETFRTIYTMEKCNMCDTDKYLKELLKDTQIHQCGG